MSQIAPAPRKGSISGAMLWMTVISLLLFWIPVLGPFIAGFVGGRVAGGVGPAIIATFLPAVIFGALLFVLATVLTGIPLIGAVAAAGGMVVALAHVGPMLVGAILGGATA